jgi:predicted AlkP superfamily pyrophosphatase or phosphodiesterase
MRSHLVLALLAACAPVASSQQPPRPKPALVVFIAVDQMRPDYFSRWPGQLSGGFKRLYDSGAFYAQGMQDHAITETAPGHSTMLSGRSPASTGVVTNELGVPDSTAPLLGVPGPGASPRRVNGTMLFDWMKAADPDTRVLSISRKDRGAILPIGKAKAPVFWYQSGIFTTSKYYGDTLPTWLINWNAREGAFKLAGKSWNLLLDEKSYAEADSQPWERGGSNFLMPKAFSNDSQRVAFEITATPYIDSLTADAALEGARALSLGKREGGTDLLSVSFSATDAVGHVYGPDSRELHDQILRLDRYLGWFMDSLSTLVGGRPIVYALTSDHGVTSFPEFLQSKNQMSGRARPDSAVLQTWRALEPKHKSNFSIEFNNGLMLADVNAIRKAKINFDSLASEIASKLANITGVTRIYTPKLLAAADTMDLDAMRWRRSIPKDFGWIAAASLARGYIWSFSPAATTHGTTNADDVLVPIVFMGPGIAAGKYTRSRTIDIGTTLAAYLGVKPLEPVEGIALPEVVKTP